MSRKKRRDNIQISTPLQKEVIPASPIEVQNRAPVQQWPNFEACWSAVVKNGRAIHLIACKAHLQANGWLDNPEMWIHGIKNFGIPVED